MSGRQFDRLVAAALILCSVSLAGALLLNGVALGPAAFGPEQRAALTANAVSLTYDDGFYYFKVAQQLASGAGSTFDGVHPTNGYQPLWLLCLAPLFWIAPAPEAALLLGLALQSILMALGAGLLYLLARLSMGRAAAALAGLLWVALTNKVALYGLEWSLHALAVLAVAYMSVRWFTGQRPAPRRYALLGLLASVAFLARLDALLLAGALGLALAWRELRDGWPAGAARRLLAFGVPVAVVALGYVGANVWWFGAPLPVSGAVKYGWSLELLRRDPRYLEYGWPAAWMEQLAWPLGQLGNPLPLALVVGTYGAAALWLACTALRAAEPAALVRSLKLWSPFIACGLLQFLCYTAVYFGSLSFAPWYYVIPTLLAALLTGAIFDAGVGMARRSGRVPASILTPLLVLGWCSAPAYTLWSIRQWQSAVRSPRRHDPFFDAARWARAGLPADAVVGSWNAGQLGYLSGHRVVDLDGLVNSWDFYRSGRADLCRYWDSSGITYLLDAFEGRRALSLVSPYPAYAACADRLELIWSGPNDGASWQVQAYRIRPNEER
jgi:hypothetical protein